ncbi:MAG: hypothetical protein ACI9YH_001466 [Colwellia sp.]|jgi:hypothetical protein
MTLSFTFIFLALFILVIIHCKTGYKIPNKNSIKWPPHLSSLAKITIYCVWIIGCLLILMEVLLICDVYHVTSFPWLVFEVSLITSIIVLLFTLILIKNRLHHDKDRVIQHLRIIFKALFLQMICVSFTSIMFVIKLYLQNS